MPGRFTQLDRLAVAKPGDLVRGVTLCETVLEAVREADAAVIVTDWDEFRSLASHEVRGAMRRPLIVDGRNLLDPEQARSAGFAYEGIGRAASPLAALFRFKHRRFASVRVDQLASSPPPVE